MSFLPIQNRHTKNQLDKRLFKRTSAQSSANWAESFGKRRNFEHFLSTFLIYTITRPCLSVSPNLPSPPPFLTHNPSHFKCPSPELLPQRSSLFPLILPPHLVRLPVHFRHARPFCLNRQHNFPPHPRLLLPAVKAFRSRVHGVKLHEHVRRFICNYAFAGTPCTLPSLRTRICEWMCVQEI